ncbi:hypothetical protein GCM10010123_36640 [Pilimelia anulata]|uniref:Uncharacterized protein n=1 Tax=Pilimelia anulata TaxID=53371 RepID=A0A8J3BFD1_9ACTN|nr:hypothetical protein [Pilimelia anulata]GGK03367.1 hypothetical protein GCM10010123_36640 [Pilimelia anulata]
MRDEADPIARVTEAIVKAGKAGTPEMRLVKASVAQALGLIAVATELRHLRAELAALAGTAPAAPLPTAPLPGDPPPAAGSAPVDPGTRASAPRPRQRPAVG